MRGHGTALHVSLKIYGMGKEKFTDRYEDWIGSFLEEDRIRCEEEVRMALRGLRQYNTQFRVRWPDGSIHHLRAMALVQRGGDGQPQRMVGTNWEIIE